MKINTTSPNQLQICNPLTDRGRSGYLSTAQKAEQSKTDTLSVSAETRVLMQQLKVFNTINTIKGLEIRDLRAVNNVLTLEAGAYYRFLLDGSQAMIVHGRGGMVIDVPYDALGGEFNSDSYFFNEQVWPVFERMQFFLYAINGRSCWLMNTEFTSAERLENFSKLGIEPGGWVEINNAGSVNRFYLMTDGTAWPESQIEGSRLSFAAKDWRKDGYTEDSIFIINGKEYKMDENGRIHIPKPEPIIWGYNVTLPPEGGIHLRLKTLGIDSRQEDYEKLVPDELWPYVNGEIPFTEIQPYIRGEKTLSELFG